MDLKLNPVSAFSASTLRPAAVGGGAAGVGRAGGAVGPASGGFGEAFKTALQNVSAAQNQASGLQTEFQLGNPKVSLEETMMAMQKAQVGFQAALHVRNRMMQAYTDVMNMQV